MTLLDYYEMEVNPACVKNEMDKTMLISKIIPRMVDYFETNNYIFVHGWIPCIASGYGGKANTYKYRRDWRTCKPMEWQYSRWYNGIDAANQGAIEPNKTIVCGHWHASYGHSHYEGRGQEFGLKADFSPYYADGIIALDACTVESRKVNCIIIED